MDYDVPHRGLKWLEYYGGHRVYHPGWDLNKGIGDQDYGNDVVCPVNAEVEYIAPIGKVNGGFGNFIILYHPAYGLWSRYAHLSRVSAKQGDHLKAGDKLGEVGNSGTTYAHLHWEVFGKEMYDIQKNWWRGKFRYYPSGKSKAWVFDHYINGLAWIDQINQEYMETSQPDKIFEQAMAWAVENKISNGQRPKDPVTRQEVWQMLLNLKNHLSQ